MGVNLVLSFSFKILNTLRNRKGFTLVELMIVVIIIGILTAGGVPLYLGYVKDAKVSSAKAVIGTIVNAEKVEHQKSGIFKAVTQAQFEGDPADNPIRIDVRDATQYWTLVVDSVWWRTRVSMLLLPVRPALITQILP
jgi:prepilin-type N-terminal cleavage/methylation domain-containing protein